MITAFGLAACLLGVRQAQPKDLSVDLYLVAGNETQIENLDWLKSPEKATLVEMRMTASLQPLVKSGAPFVILDWGPTSVVPDMSKFKLVKVLVRTTDTYASKSDSVTTNGVTHSRVLETTTNEMVFGSAINVKPIADATGYVCQVNLHVGTPGSYGDAIFQDINSFRQATKQPSGQGRDGMPPTILISPNSIQDSRSYLHDKSLPSDGVCLCQWGLADKGAPNYASFPPAGVAAHYKLSRRDGKWAVSLVGYLR